MKHQPAATPAAEGVPAGLEALSSLAVTVLNAHANAAGLCAVCGCAWPCEVVVVADHNYDLAAL
ncbi:MAG: hypothetical protein ACRDTH_26290 [Pseudonocardiaceae bacterium]